VPARTIAMLAALGAALAWIAKALVIATAGLDQSPLESVLFVAGLLCAVVAAAALGAALTEGRPAAVRLAAACAVVLGLLAVTGLTVVLVSVVQPDDAGWAKGEINLWVSAAALLAAATVTWSRRRSTR